MVAVLLLKPRAEELKGVLCEAETLVMSSVTLAECCIVLERRAGLSAGESRTRIEALTIEIAPLNGAAAVIAADARLRFPIRFGEAFIYALAKERSLPILTLDAEFAKTDAALVPLLERLQPG